MNDKSFTATLTDPSGYSAEWTTWAKNKSEARAEIARLYRREVPSSKNGFYTFGQNKFRWKLNKED